MEKSNGQTFVTDQYAVAAHGKAEREWPFIACSDGAFTEVCDSVASGITTIQADHDFSPSSTGTRLHSSMKASTFRSDPS